MSAQAELERLLALAQRLAREAGAIQRASYEAVKRIESKSQPNDLVTEVDHACEAHIVGALAIERPHDAVLAVCGGALRRYLLSHDELPGPSLVSVAPVSIRNTDGNGGGSHGLSLMRLPLGTELEDPVRRLRSIQRHTAADEDIEQAIGAKELTDITKHAPAATLALSARLLAGSTLGVGQRTPLASCTITNVPGPAIPLYLNGARMTYFSAIMPISDGMGLVFSVTSYDGKIFISPTSCREQIPDPEHFGQCIRDSFQEYLALAKGRKSRSPRKKKVVPRTRAAKGPAGKRKRAAKRGAA